MSGADTLYNFVRLRAVSNGSTTIPNNLVNQHVQRYST